jgi:type IV pilus assembly protein PilE
MGKRGSKSGVSRGFTLIEVMVVVAIVAIIAAIAYPAYLDHIRKARRAEGKAALLKAIQLQERAYTSTGTYTTDLTALFGAAGTPVMSGENPASGAYTLTATADPDLASGVIITATPTAPFTDPDCGVLTINSAGVRTFTGTSGKGTDASCL